MTARQKSLLAKNEVRDSISSHVQLEGHFFPRDVSEYSGDYNPEEESRYNAVGIANGYELYDGGIGVRDTVEVRILSFPHLPYRFWGSHSLLSKWYRDSSPGGKAAGA
jgi:hypothetical protein